MNSKHHRDFEAPWLIIFKLIFDSAKACVILFAVPMTLFIPSPTIIKIAKSCSILNSSTSHFDEFHLILLFLYFEFVLNA